MYRFRERLTHQAVGDMGRHRRDIAGREADVERLRADFGAAVCPGSSRTVDFGCIPRAFALVSVLFA
jgi:hypothetical protein